MNSIILDIKDVIYEINRLDKSSLSETEVIQLKSHIQRLTNELKTLGDIL